MSSISNDIRDYLQPHIHEMTNKQISLVESASKCRLPGLAMALIDMFSSPNSYTEMTFEDRMEKCLNGQLDAISKSRFARMYRNSGLPRKVYLSSIRPRSEAGVTPDLLRKLTELNYLEAGANIIFMGPNGVGKSTLAIAAAVQAITRGHSVLYYSMNQFSMMLESMNSADYIKLLKKMKSAKLCILDDWGMAHLSDTIILRLAELAEARYGTCSTVFTTQLQRHALGNIAEKESLALSSLKDRLFRPSDIYVTLSGSSLRGTAGEIIGEKQ